MNELRQISPAVDGSAELRHIPTAVDGSAELHTMKAEFHTVTAEFHTVTATVGCLACISFSTIVATDCIH